MDPLISFLLRHDRFVLTTHINPDGDAIGCEIALASWLNDRGKDVTIINHNATPFVYRFLDPGGTIRTFDPSRDVPLIATTDALVILDCNHPNRVGDLKHAVTASPATKVVIDHHLDPTPFTDHMMIDTEATSTGEILFTLLRSSGQGAITPRIAQALYCAIMTDTGSFRYPRIDAETHTIIAQLIEAGADPVEIYRQVYDRWSSERIHLLGDALSGMVTVAGGRIAAMTVTQEMMRRTGTSEEDTDNFTTYPMSVDGVVAGMLFVELADGLKVSFRSRGEIPINELAREFGGNGHKNAAGARLKNRDFAGTVATVLTAAEKYIPKTGNGHNDD